MNAGDWIAIGFLAAVGAFGFLSGALWQSQVHLRDLRSHARWTDEYTRSVVRLLNDLVTPDRNPEGE